MTEKMPARFSAVVTDIRLDSREHGVALWQILLDHTEFSVEENLGWLTARSVSGAVLVAMVERVVQDSDGQLWHVTKKPLPVGTIVECEVDGASDSDPDPK